VHAHRIEVLDGADDDNVVLQVAHHLELEFLPANDGLFDQNRMHRTQIETTRHDRFEFFTVERDTAAGAAERERRTDDDREPEALDAALRLADVADDFASRGFQTDLGHGLLEQEPIFGHFHGLRLGADHLDFVLVENPAVSQVNSNVQRCLAADRGKQRVRPFASDNGCDEFGRQRFDIGAVREFGIRHDRRRIRIDQNDFVAFFAERLARLRAGIIEFARLADDDRPGTNDQDFVNVGTFRHSASDRKTF